MSSTAAAVRRSKEKHPELYCRHPRCLWRIVTNKGPNPCRNHPLAPAPVDPAPVAPVAPAARFDLVENAAHRAAQHAAMYPVTPAVAACLCGAPHPVGASFYVSVVDAGRVGLLAGPYAIHQDALDRVELVRTIANRVNTWAHFYSFGTVAVLSTETGKLNDLLAVEESRTC